MAKGAKRDTAKLNWYSTRELQFISCLACRIYWLQLKREATDKEQFLTQLMHHYPKWYDAIPDWVYKQEPSPNDRVWAKAIKMNDPLGNEHPTHEMRRSTTGRYWEIACQHIDNPTTFTPKEEDIKRIINMAPASVLQEMPEEVEEVFKTARQLMMAIEKMIATLKSRLHLPPEL
jgi:hypothetical protein